MPSVLHTVRDLGRLREIASVLGRHGFGELLQRTGLGTLAPGRPQAGESSTPSSAERVRRVCEELGPTFVKLGQLMSTRPDMVPADIIHELRRLQDDVPPVPFEAMRTEIEQQLGAPLTQLFTHFEQTPLASASIGQVYRARLATDGDEHEVVVKAQRPNIASTVERDIDLLYWLAHAIERSIPEARLYCPVKLVGEFDRAIRAELDFALEADNAERFAEHFTDLPTVKFPRVHRQLSTGKVITLEFIDGRNVFEAVKSGADGERIAKNAIEIMIRMIFEHGFFHADPHPGNILITGTSEEPVIALLDLGLVGRLTPRARDRLIELLLALGREDSRAIADALYAIGRPMRKIDRDAFEAEVATLTDKYMRRPLGDIPFADLIRDLAGGALRYGIEVPSDFLMVGKALMTVEGIGRQLYPSLDLSAELKPHLTRILGYRYSPERLGGDALLLATRLANAAGEFPTHMEDILAELRGGQLGLQVRQPSLQHAADRLGRRLFAGVCIGALLVSATMLFIHGRHWLGAATLVVAVGWGGMHSLAMALGRNRPPS